MNQASADSLPPGWASSIVGQVCDVVGGGTPSTENESYWSGDIPWITSADIGDVQLISVRRHITREAVERSATNLVPPGSVVVVTRVGLGKVALTDTSICFSQDSQGLVFNAELIDPLYLTYHLKQSVQAFKWMGRGTTISGVTKRQLIELPLKIAPLPEQRRIVAEIEKHFTRLDAAVAALERARANLKRYRAAVLKAACEGRLVPIEAELARVEGREYEQADMLLDRTLRERRERWEADQLAKMQAAGKPPQNDRWKAKYKEPAPPDANSLPQLPEGWLWATVHQLAADEANSLTDGPFGSNLKTSHYTPDGPRVIRLQNVGDASFIDARAYISQEHYDRLAKHRVEAGDLVIAALGENLPRACVVPPSVGPAIVKADCIRFMPHGQLSIARYLNLALNAEPTRRRVGTLVHGVGRPRLNLSEIKSITLPLPPILEQSRIANEAERRLSVVDEMDGAIERSLSRAERLRQSVLKRAFEGKLVPQDPNDEPASVLLERIRAERIANAEKSSSRGGRSPRGTSRTAAAAAAQMRLEEAMRE